MERFDNIVLHIGLHKTGTTFLQTNVFPKIEGIDAPRKIPSLINTPENKTTLISHEPLSGDPFGGKWIEEFKYNVKGLSKLFPKSKCIIGFRRHDRLIKSLYKQYLKEGNIGGAKHIFEIGKSGIIKNDDIKFKKRIKIIKKTFSEVFVYTQEWLSENLKSFLSRLCKFVEVRGISVEDIDQTRKNVGVKTRRQINILKVLNKVNLSLGKIGITTLNNKILRNVGLTPYSICRRKITGMGSDPYTLPEPEAAYLRDHFAEDWEYVQKFVDR